MNLKLKLKKLAHDFDLKYNLKWFNVMWISKKENKYLEYLGMCPDPIYTRFGKTTEERIANIDKFAKSREFDKIKNQYGGQAINIRGAIKGIEYCRTIKNPKLRERLSDLYKRIKSKMKDDNLAILTKTDDKRDKENLTTNILLHEWIHNLLHKNDISFQSISTKYWKYDEGLVTYLEFYALEKLSYLEFGRDKTKYPNARAYYIYGIKFRNLLKSANSSKERKEAIIKLMNKLK